MGNDEYIAVWANNLEYYQDFTIFSSKEELEEWLNNKPVGVEVITAFKGRVVEIEPIEKVTAYRVIV